MAKEIADRISLWAQRPDLMEEWDDRANASAGLFPEQLAPFSHRKATWICSSCGNSWVAEINSRSRGTGCPYCKRQKISESKRKVKQGNSLFERFPSVAEEWYQEKNGVATPNDVNSGSEDRYWWKCKYGHEWEASVYSRTYGHTNCPKCSEEMHTSFREQAVYFYLSRHFACKTGRLFKIEK